MDMRSLFYTSQSDSDIQVWHHVGTLDQTPFFPLNMKTPQKPLDVVDLFIIGPIEKFVFFWCPKTTSRANQDVLWLCGDATSTARGLQTAEGSPR
jgi:hypothetical protein